jgi:RNA polymerase sigma factor (sigma-70 family)
MASRNCTMADKGLNRVVEYLRRAAGPKGASALADAQLLERFVEEGDSAAFEILVWRHGGMVLHVCGRHLRRHHDVEDAFQATFLVLVRRARSIRKGQSLSSWLYKVAYRVALRARRETARRADIEESLLTGPSPEAGTPACRADLSLVVLEELNRLREKYRLPLVLCYLKGLTTAEASKQLGCPQGTIHSRMSAARDQLRKRLARRGFTLPAAGLGTVFCTSADAAVVPARLVTAAIQTAMHVQSGKALVGGAAPKVVALAEGVLKSMFMTKLRLGGAAFAALCVISVAVGQLMPVVFADKPGTGAKASLVGGRTDTLALPLEASTRLGIQIGTIQPRGEAQRQVLNLIGTLNYDPDSLFIVRSRYPGEVAEVGLVVDAANPKNPRPRPVRFGDKVKQGDVLAVLWSQQIGAARAAMVDAICALSLSQDTLTRYKDLYEKGAMTLSSLKVAERQVQADSNTLLTAERSLRMWKLDNREIDEIKAAAKIIHEQKKARSADDEVKWARAEIRVPWFDKKNPDRELVVVEKNANIGDVVDPISSPALFKLTDTSRLQFSAHPPEDDLPLLRRYLSKGNLRWQIQVHAFPNDEPLDLPVLQIAPSVDPNLRTPIVIGYVPNKDNKYIVGLTATATVRLPVTRQELSVPASALVEEGGKTYVLIQPNPKTNEFALRRVSIVRRDRDVAHIVFLLTPSQEAQGVEALHAGERIVTSGAVELKALLDDLKARGD